MGEAQLTPRRAAVSAVAAVFLAAYFAVAGLHVGPLNSLKIQYGDDAAAVLVPYFDQNWQLFAPDPISSERNVLVRARNSSTGDVTQWVDITSPANHESRSSFLFSPRKSRVISNGVAMYLSPDPYREYVDESSDVDDPIQETPEPLLTREEAEFRENAVEMMTRYASSVVVDRFGVAYDEIQLRLMVHEFPPFSERHRWNEVGEVSTEDLPWRPLIQGVG